MTKQFRSPVMDSIHETAEEKAGVRTKTEAVRLALQPELQPISEKLRASERIKKSLALADAMGPSGNDDFDVKAFTDEMWGEA